MTNKDNKDNRETIEREAIKILLIQDNVNSCMERLRYIAPECDAVFSIRNEQDATISALQLGANDRRKNCLGKPLDLAIAASSIHAAAEAIQKLMENNEIVKSPLLNQKQLKVLHVSILDVEKLALKILTGINPVDDFEYEE